MSDPPFTRTGEMYPGANRISLTQPSTHRRPRGSQRKCKRRCPLCLERVGEKSGTWDLGAVVKIPTLGIEGRNTSPFPLERWDCVLEREDVEPGCQFLFL